VAPCRIAAEGTPCEDVPPSLRDGGRPPCRRRTPSGKGLPELNGPPRVWVIFLTYLAAVAGIISVSGLAIFALVAAYPDVPERALLAGLPGLLAGSLAASTALVLTILVIVRPSSPAVLHLVPGRETGRSLAVMVVGMIALGQALDSAMTVAGLGETGSIAAIRRAIEGATGPELVAAIIVIGVIAGAAEETFFRGYMQTRLRQHWRAPVAVLASSLCFALLHVDVSGVHVVMALLLSCYLGFVTEVAGSVLPAIVCHVANNTVSTVQTALALAVAGRDANLALSAGCAVTFAVCVVWLARPDHPVSSP